MHGPTTDDEEVDQMMALMTSDLDVLPLGTYVKLEVAQENRSAADEIRRKRAEGDELRRQREQERSAGPRPHVDTISRDSAR